MDIRCTEKELFVFKKIAHAAAAMGVPCYIIGGFVRDKILGRPTKDADIVCVGNGINLAHKVAESFHPKPPVAFFKTFGTAQIRLDDWEIEFVGARKESYQYHSRNPEVVPGTLARPDTGGLSGATPGEAVSWGKIDPDMLPGTVVCYLDNTVSLPLLTAYAKARVGKRRLKRLYHRREAMMTRLVRQYQSALKFRNDRAQKAKKVRT